MWYKKEGDAITLQVYVQPGAKSTEMAGFYDELPKIRLHSPPIDGRANDALIKYIAQCFNVPSRQVTLIRGEKSRRKTLQITGSAMNPEVLILTNKP